MTTEASLRMSAPRSKDELLARARLLSGRTLGELAETHCEDVPPDLRRAKGWVGQFLEACLGATAGNRSVPDFERLGIELKTLPICSQSHLPRETTYVCTVQLTDVDALTWEDSSVYRKLRHVLWLPVQSNPELPLHSRLVGTPILWQPSAEQTAALKKDWEDHMEVIQQGLIDTISGREGKYLQIRPKGARATDRTWAVGEHDTEVLTMPRGFYLRTNFTRWILQNFL